MRPYKGARLATIEDNEAILRFFSTIPMEGSSLRLRTDRSPDFFSLLRFQGDRPLVFIAEKSLGEITAVGTIVLRDGFIHGRRERIGYLGDLRTKFDRVPLRIWRSVFAELLERSGEIEELEGCKHWVAACIDENRLAQRAILDHRKGRHRFDLLTRYRMINVFARPIPSFKKSTYSVLKGSQKDLPRLSEFYDRENRTQAFGFAPGELLRRLDTWKDLGPKDFVFIENSQRELLGMTAAWSPHHSKRIIADRLPPALRLLTPFVPVPRAGEAVQSVYLTHLTIRNSLSKPEREGVFAALFDRVFAESRSQGLHMLSFCDFEQNSFARGLTGYLKQSIPMSLYSARSEKDLPLQWEASELRQPGFEIALV